MYKNKENKNLIIFSFMSEILKIVFINAYLEEIFVKDFMSCPIQTQSNSHRVAILTPGWSCKCKYFYKIYTTFEKF